MGGIRGKATKELAAVESWSDLWYSKEQKHFELSGNSSFFCAGEEGSDIFRWLKHNAIWLKWTPIPGYGFAAGIEDYPVLWCDSEWHSWSKCSRTVRPEQKHAAISKASERTNGTGQIIHEMYQWMVFNPEPQRHSL